MVPVTLHKLRKAFGSTVAVDDVDLMIGAGDLFFLLGPSGCGKTTLLRMLAGFIEPTSGTIKFGDDDVTKLPVNRRETGMVFQGYALWPHMTVRQNVAFGLTVGSRKKTVSAAQRQERVDRALKLVQITDYADRKPNQLSGGQQQRVALARALVVEPRLLLLDEPLSNLDAKLRLEMREQIRHVCKTAGLTGVYVTHDQKEALSMADRVAVMSQGRVMQVGPPRELYERPANRFVADFLGETNFLSAEVKSRADGRVTLESAAGMLESSVFPEDLPATGNVTCSVRPEALRLEAVNGHGGLEAGASSAVNTFVAERQDAVYLGEMAQHRVTVADTPLKVFELNPRLGPGGGQVVVTVDPRDVVVLSD
ncbi:MAG: ABC transporter ATP-binding protein [Planctomycetota bacterium]